VVVTVGAVVRLAALSPLTKPLYWKLRVGREAP
jgi:hypothetical protein